MAKPISRRDFLKLAGLLPLSAVAPRVFGAFETQEQLQSDRKNVIVVVFDALSAHNIGLYGYSRETMPNLSRLAERAVVYHNHYAGGNFTSPGTASLLTGTLPWTNRAFKPLGSVSKEYINKSLFSVYPNHIRFAYTHNPWAEALLRQFRDDIEVLIPLDRFMLSNNTFIQKMFSEDRDIASVSWIRTINSVDDNYAYSLFLSKLYDLYTTKREPRLAHLEELFPRGIPGYMPNDDFYLLDETLAGLGNLVVDAQTPFVSYFHLLPPHAPYRTHRDFYNHFQNDGLIPLTKPTDLFQDELSAVELNEQRTWYDEFILYADREFGKFYDYLENAGLLENTWLIFTSDHGEMFERGIIGHRTPVLYEPAIRVPLLIFEPGRTSRTDVYEPTSAIDLLPTLLQVTGQAKAAWTEGIVLPPFGGIEPDKNRSIYILECSDSNKKDPIDVATVALRKGQYKLNYFFGYKELGAGVERIELYDIEDDPEELQDLSQVEKSIVEEMLREVKAKLSVVNQPYL